MSLWPRALRPRCTPAGVVLAVYAAVLLVATLGFSWWRMECRAPQYGARMLTLDVGLTGVTGDVQEIDGLGHYVGMRGVASYAPLERALAPYGLAAAALAALALIVLPPGWWRRGAAAVVVIVPLFFIGDLWWWQHWAVNHLDPKASLNLIQNRVQARVVGSYSVAQFHVKATFQTGFWMAVIASANALGFLLAEWRAVKLGLRRAAAGAATLLVLLAATRLASAATLRVGPDAPYQRVSDALAAAAVGDEVRVSAGIYRERLQITRAATLVGEPGAVIDAGGQGTVIDVTAGGTTIRGLTLRGSGDSLLGEDSGIKLTKAPGCIIENNRLEDVLFGVLANSSPGARLRHNRITGKDLIIPRRGDGIRLYDSSDAEVDDNRLERGRDLAIWQSHRVLTRRNTVRNGRYGLHYMYCDDDVFEDNVFEHNQVGGAIMYSRGLRLARNRFSGSRGPSAHGLLIKTADGLVAEENLLLDNSTGLFMEDTPSSLLASVELRRNVVAGNDVGVELQPSVTRVVFSENAFISNRSQVVVRGRGRGANRWDDGARGNYWSDYLGFDGDGDGVGDTPYREERFFEDLAGRWPELGLLRMSPATEALEQAARAFPVLAPEATAVDERPLMRAPAGLPPPVRTAQPGLLVAGLGMITGALWVVVRARRVPGGAV